MRYFYLFITLFIITNGFGQESKLDIANKAFDNFEYEKAIPLYLDILETTDHAAATIKLAECYRKTDNSKEAEHWFSKVVRLPETKPKYLLYYARALQANSKCTIAKKWLEKYKALEPNDRGITPLRWECDSVVVHQNNCKRCYELSVIPVNTKRDDFSPVLYKNGLLFTSFIEEDDRILRGGSWSNYPFLKVWYTKMDTLDALNHEYLYDPNPKEVKGMNSKYVDGPIAFTKDFSKGLITRNNYFAQNQDEESAIVLKIFTADLIDGQFKNYRGLPFNSDEYSVAHGAFGKGNKMYFSSDMPGGFGGMDLYYSEYEDGQWGPPINLGSDINTEGNEIFPFYHERTNKLYFASDGLEGVGGLDIFYVPISDHLYAKPVNLGQPINSLKDDFSIYWNNDGDFGFLVSNRVGSKGGDDIYGVLKNASQTILTVVDEATSKPIKDVMVRLQDETLTFYTDEKGQVQLDLPFDDCFIVEVQHYDYEVSRIQICTKRTKFRQIIEVTTQMKKKK